MTVVTAAQGSRSQLLHKKQSALGTLATGNYTKLRYSTHSLNTQIQPVESDEIRADRQVVDLRHGGRHAMGSIVTNLIYADHDLLLESAMFSTFDTDQILIGVAPQYLSIEDGALDISQYRMFADMVVNRMQLSLRPNAMVRATFDLVGTNGANPSGSSGGGTPVNASTNQPFDTFNAALFDNAAETGSELAVVTGLEMTLENGVQPVHVVGQQTPAFLEFGRGRVTGQLTMLWTDDIFLDRFLGEEEFALVANITDPDGNAMELRMPRVKASDGRVPVENEQSRIVTLPFTALYDSSLASALQISRT